MSSKWPIQYYPFFVILLYNFTLSSIYDFAVKLENKYVAHLLTCSKDHCCWDHLNSVILVCQFVSGLFSYLRKCSFIAHLYIHIFSFIYGRRFPWVYSLQFARRKNRLINRFNFLKLIGSIHFQQPIDWQPSLPSLDFKSKRKSAMMPSILI